MTQIYCYEGQMRELFSAEDSGLMPEDGEVLMPLEDMNLSLEGELLTIDVRHPNGQTDTLRLCLRHRGRFCREESSNLDADGAVGHDFGLRPGGGDLPASLCDGVEESRDSEDRDRAVIIAAKRSGGYQGHRGTAGTLRSMMACA